MKSLKNDFDCLHNPVWDYVQNNIMHMIWGTIYSATLALVSDQIDRLMLYGIIKESIMNEDVHR